MQHAPLQAAIPLQLRQSFRAALHPFAQGTVVPGLQTPVPALQSCALVVILVATEQVAGAPHSVVAALFVVGTHIIVPVEQDCTPFLQGRFGGSQGVLGVHAPHTLPRQNLFVPHIVPSPALLHAPEVLQVPVWQFATKQPVSTDPGALGEHIPVAPILQAWQVGQLDVAQQTPFTQFPNAHSVPAAHA